MLAQLAEERHGVLDTGVGDVGQMPEVQPQPATLLADRHGADSQDPIALSPAPRNRRWPCGEELQRTVGVSTDSVRVDVLVCGAVASGYENRTSEGALGFLTYERAGEASVQRDPDDVKLEYEIFRA
jgi:hypothetical protein